MLVAMAGLGVAVVMAGPEGKAIRVDRDRLGLIVISLVAIVMAVRAAMAELAAPVGAVAPVAMAATAVTAAMVVMVAMAEPGVVCVSWSRVPPHKSAWLDPD